ncbi:MAG: S26 family signal peptidase [Planctomycetota bacterium]
MPDIVPDASNEQRDPAGGSAEPAAGPEAGPSGLGGLGGPPPRAFATTVPDTCISIVMTLALAFVFRAFVLEAFVIPTGSMAPTLLGAHYRIESPSTGAVFAVDRRAADTSQQATVRDPYSGVRLSFDGSARLDGDRIFVRKRTPLTPLPERFDVVVFRSPTEPDERVIKRLIGRPGEQIALVDGDVFVRSADGTEPGRSFTWHEQGWQVQRKPAAVQRLVWQPVYDMAFADPRSETSLGPWTPMTAGWPAGTGPRVSYAGDGPTALVWDREQWEIRDRLAYNDIDDRRDQRLGSGGSRGGLPPNYHVSDLRLRFGYEVAAGAAAGATWTLETRSRVFELSVADSGEGTTARIRVRVAGGETWAQLAEAPVELAPRGPTLIEFEHVDQACVIRVGGREAARAEYDWTIRQRIERAIPGAELSAMTDLSDEANPLSDPDQYQPPSLRLDLAGPATLHRLRLDRDVYYHPHHPRYRVSDEPPPLGTHPITTVTLGPGQLFVLGDNSPASRDGRTWGRPDPWVADAFPSTATEGVVPEQLLIGEAFLVYFPAMHRRGLIPVPDFGRMRLIR